MLPVRERFGQVGGEADQLLGIELSRRGVLGPELAANRVADAFHREPTGHRGGSLARCESYGVPPNGGTAAGMSREQEADAKAPARGSRDWSIGAREALLAFLFLALVATAIYLSYVRHGGFYLDDWAEAAGRYYPPGGGGFSSVLSYFHAAFEFRPTLILYMVAKFYVFGAKTELHLARGASLVAIAAVLLYMLLRSFGVPWQHAGMIAALSLAFPWFDSTRLWMIASNSTLAVALVFAGILVALAGLKRGSWHLHACAALLDPASILAYEVTLPLVVAAGVLYTIRYGWRAAQWPWLVDLAVVLAAGLWVATHTHQKVSGISGDLAHLGEIVVAGGTLLGRTVYPVGPYGHTTTMLLILAAVFAAGVLVHLATGRGNGDGWGLREWLLLGAAGLAVAALGWAMLIPADPYYTPSIYGVTNRINVLAGLGLVIVVYSALGTGATLVGMAIPRIAAAVPTLIVVLAAMLGAAYIHVVERHSDLWATAYRAELEGMDRIQSAYPSPPSGALIIASNYPAYQTLGVPIFSTDWDLSGMVKLRYGNGSLAAVPRTEQLDFSCLPRGIEIEDEGVATSISAEYGKAMLVDLQTGRRSVPRNQLECRRVEGEFPPGPMYLESGY